MSHRGNLRPGGKGSVAPAGGEGGRPGAARSRRAGVAGRGLRGPLPAPAPLAARAPLGGRALRAKTNTSHKRPLCGAAPRPPAPPPTGQSRLCARPATPAAQEILISVWVCAGRWKSKPPFFQRPCPDPRLRPPASPGLRIPLLAAAGSGALPEPPPRVRISPSTAERPGAP